MANPKRRGSLERITTSEAVALTGFGWRTIIKRAADAGLEGDKRPTGTYWKAAELLAAVYEMPAGKLDATQERARRDKESADKLAMENERTRGELVAVEDVERVWTDIAAAIRAVLLALPVRIAQVALGAGSMREIENAARAEIHGAMHNLNRGMLDIAQKGRAGAYDAAGADGESVGGGAAVSGPG